MPHPIRNKARPRLSLPNLLGVHVPTDPDQLPMPAQVRPLQAPLPQGPLVLGPGAPRRPLQPEHAPAKAGAYRLLFPEANNERRDAHGLLRH